MTTQTAINNPAQPDKERCYRCHRPFPTRPVIMTQDGQAAVVKREPIILTAWVWSIPNRQLPVPVCPACQIVADIVAEARRHSA